MKYRAATATATEISSFGMSGPRQSPGVPADDPPPVKAEADGNTRLARLVSREGKERTVQYLGGKKAREEAVARDRVRLLFGAGAEQRP
jgi:hypothetical protein